MRMFPFFFDNEIWQRHDIERLREAAATRAEAQRTRASRQRRSLETLDGRVRELEGEVGELALLCRALLETLQEQGNVDPALLTAALHRIDLEDGEADGRITRNEPEEERPQAPRPSLPTSRRRRR